MFIQINELASGLSHRERTRDDEKKKLHCARRRWTGSRQGDDTATSSCDVASCAPMKSVFRCRIALQHEANSPPEEHSEHMSAMEPGGGSAGEGTVTTGAGSTTASDAEPLATSNSARMLKYEQFCNYARLVSRPRAVYCSTPRSWHADVLSLEFSAVNTCSVIGQ